MENDFVFGSEVFHKTGGYPMVIISNSSNGLVTVRYWHDTKGVFIEDQLYTVELKPKKEWLNKDAGKLPDEKLLNN